MISDPVEKFVIGEPIADQQNPFRHDDQPYTYLRRRVTLTDPKIAEQDNDDDLDGPISTEEVLNQSKFVKTYIKNPDPVFTLDSEKIKRIQREERSKPIPLRRQLLNNRHQQKSSVQPTIKKRWIGREKSLVYPDLADIKVRVGAALDPGDVVHLNPAEVQLSAAQFDARFKTIDEFGSQDDIDTIAEKTESEVAAFATGDQVVITNNLQSEPKNKSYTNTVSSREFQDYLKAKGLALVPLERRIVNGKVIASVQSQQPSSTIKPPPTTVTLRRNEQPIDRVIKLNEKKPSVFHRLINRNQVPMHDPPRRMPVHSNSQFYRRTAPPPHAINYSNVNGIIGSPAQRHSTPIKSTVPQQLHQLADNVSIGRDTVDKNISSIAPTHAENIYESTDRLREGVNSGVVLRNRPQLLSGVGQGSGHQAALQQQPQLGSMPREQIYAHLYAFYQKSKRNSVADGSIGRSQSRNSGEDIYAQPILNNAAMVNNRNPFQPYYHTKPERQQQPRPSLQQGPRLNNNAPLNRISNGKRLDFGSVTSTDDGK